MDQPAASNLVTGRMTKICNATGKFVIWIPIQGTDVYQVMLFNEQPTSDRKMLQCFLYAISNPARSFPKTTFNVPLSG